MPGKGHTANVRQVLHHDPPKEDRLLESWASWAFPHRTGPVSCLGYNFPCTPMQGM